MTKSLVHTEKAPTALSERFSVEDPQEYHATVATAAAGGAGAALLAHVGASLVGGPPGFSAMVFAVTAGSLAAVASRGSSPHPKWMRAIVGGGFGILGGVLHTVCTPWPWLGALLLGAAAAPVLAKGESAGRMAVTGGATGILAMAGLYVLGVLQSKGILAGVMPGPLATAVAGGATGLFVGLGALPKHLRPARDRVETAYRAALEQEDGEIHEVLSRSFSIYTSVRQDLASRDGETEAALGPRVSDLSMRILSIAEHCRKIESDLSASAFGELEERIESLQRKADSAQDPTAKATLAKAIESLQSQRDSVESIGRGLERVVARLHANVALLEKVRFSLVHARSADAERIGGESSPLTEAIEELSRELDATASAVGEVFGESEASGVFQSFEDDTKALTDGNR